MSTERIVFVLSIAGLGFLACRNPAPKRPSARPGFDDLVITISAHQAVDSPVGVLVQLAHSAGRKPCFVAPDDLRITADGHPLEITDRGGPSRPSHFSGIEMPDLIGCRPVMAWASGLAPRATSTIVVEQGAKYGEVTAPNLLPQRTVRILPSTTVRPGDRVTLDFTDHDQWNGSQLSTAVSLYSPDGFGISIDHTRLDIAPPRFSFVVPSIRPGRAFLTLYPGDLRVASRGTRCHGFRSCEVSPNNHHDQLELAVIP